MDEIITNEMFDTGPEPLERQLERKNKEINKLNSEVKDLNIKLDALKKNVYKKCITKIEKNTIIFFKIKEYNYLLQDHYIYNKPIKCIINDIKIMLNEKKVPIKKRKIKKIQIRRYYELRQPYYTKHIEYIDLKQMDLWYYTHLLKGGDRSSFMYKKDDIQLKIIVIIIVIITILLKFLKN